MSIIYIFILCMKFVSFVKSDKLPCIFCAYDGSMGKTSYKFSVNDIPERCEAIVYGNHYFTEEPSTEDKAAITALTSANKIVWTLYSDEQVWIDVLNKNDPKAIDQRIAPMIKYLSTSKVTGVILAYTGLTGGQVPDYATKMNSVICKIKAGVPGIKVGLFVNAFQSPQYKNKTLFDFTVVNPVVDLYVIDLTAITDICAADTTAKGGRVKIKSSDPNEITLEKVCKYTSDSPMEQSKIIVYVIDVATKLEGDTEMSQTYSEYCTRHDQAIWCGDTMQLFYDQVSTAKSHFKGIMISYLDLDDYENKCGCGKFPVANTYIDAWQGLPIKCCPKI